jgi:hypothetical protein
VGIEPATVKTQTRKKRKKERKKLGTHNLRGRSPTHCPLGWIPFVNHREFKKIYTKFRDF